MMREHHIPVARTARYVTLGDPTGTPREVWFVCHGYGQLAERFLRHFTSLDDGHRLIVAPEALSRFYVDAPARGSHVHAPVGASWMTREDRLSEIDDYIRYLDALYAHVMRALRGASPLVVVLGFSQGVATACRWLARGRSRADRLVLWGGLVPHDLDLDGDGAALRRLELLLVSGDGDEFVDAAARTAQAERLARHALSFREIRYAGGHRIDARVLARAAGSEG
jgi:predicted esterase